MTIPADVLARLATQAESADRTPDWPAGSWDALRTAGVLGRAVPREYGGTGLGTVGLLRAGETLAAACLTTAFILSQRDAAVRRLLAGPDRLKERYLPRVAAGDAFITVGLSQLTTSRQHGGPALLATPTAGGFRLDGDIPWVTGADRAEAVVTGATLADASQVLVVLPTDRPGVRVGEPMELAALYGSRTSAVRCDRVEVEAELVLGGPTGHVLGTVGGGGLETSALALGLAGAAVDHLRDEATRRADLRNVADRFEAARVAACRRLHELAVTPPAAELVLAARVGCTRLALRATQAALVAAKGAGFVAPHPVGRWSRQALFFLVWSCPRPVTADLLAELSPANLPAGVG
ncbi:MAG TPA: acyl-CoA dehydrogenase family protein [Gemmataceae bacterium]|nr:acyl-CoA dehydrogenase family protein [Gemmataceae bacterium]